MTEELEEEVPEEIIPGVARALSPLVRRILASNPSVRTGFGTNTYLVGIDEIVVIDPGPDDAEHRRSITGCGGDRIRWIMLTCGDPEHAAGAEALKAETGAEILASPKLEGIAVDDTLDDAWTLVGTEFRLKVHYTPGTTPEAISLELPEEKLLFTGDLVMEGSSMAIVPPHGDMTAYLESLATMKGLRLQRLAPAHGYVLEGAKDELQAVIDHRLEREAQIAAAVGSLDPAGVDAITAEVYGSLDEERHELAAATVVAHLQKLLADGTVKARGGAWLPT
ncbi:MAG: MBL fold metallo-hydrolase [Acidimicrobiia bacterium]|nr:MBL fold metallo-hydrolase [Acidimicrobiia bacterium]